MKVARYRHRRGLSLVELMISLAISAMLLTAVAAAYSASAAAIDTNDRFFRASQAARVSMNQLLTDIRRSDSVKVDGNIIELIRPTDMRTPDEWYRIYSYEPAEQRLVLNLVDLDDVKSPAYRLSGNLTSASFVADTRPDVIDGLPVDVVIRVTVTLVVQVDNTMIRLSGSAVPRRALIY
jgi:prepilin-type N-terminal cleavage/methylation domain-containing protein